MGHKAGRMRWVWGLSKKGPEVIYSSVMNEHTVPILATKLRSLVWGLVWLPDTQESGTGQWSIGHVSVCTWMCGVEPTGEKLLREVKAVQYGAATGETPAPGTVPRHAHRGPCFVFSAMAGVRWLLMSTPWHWPPALLKEMCLSAVSPFLV